MQSVKQGGIKYHLELFNILLMFYNQYLIQSDISTILGYLMSTLLYTYILDIWDLVWFGFNGISTLVNVLLITFLKKPNNYMVPSVALNH